MHRFKRTLSGLLSALLFLSNGVLAHSAESNIWQARRESRQLARVAPLPIPAMRPASAIRSHLAQRAAATFKIPAVRDAYASIPLTAATVRKVLIPERPNGKAIIYVQDVHGHDEAQFQIAATLTAVADAIPLPIMALEGAPDGLDVSPFQKFAPGPHKNAVAERLVREHAMSGAIMAAWNARKPLSVIGVDSADFHRANVDAYLASRDVRETFRARWNRENAELATEKAATYNPALASFDATVRDHRTGSISLSEFAADIVRRRVGATEEISRFLSASEMERSLDHTRIESERKEVLRRLVVGLSEQRSADLLDLGLAYRSGQIGVGDFNAELSRFCDEAGVPLSKFPALAQYLAYVRASERLDAERLSEDLATAERRTLESLTVTAAEKRLIRRDRALHLADRLIDFSLSRDEWRAYQLVRSDLDGWDLGVFENFYIAAEARDMSMATGVMRAMAESNAGAAALVTGGFHSSGIERRLTDAGYSVLRVTPRLTKVDGVSTLAALSVFAQEKTPLENIFEGRALFLSAHPFPVHTRRLAALRLAGATVLAGAATISDMLSWLAGVLPWSSLNGTVKDGRFNVSGSERGNDGTDRNFSVSVNRSGDVSLSGRLGAIAIRPLIETAALLILSTALNTAFPGYSLVSLLVSGLLFAAVHRSVYERDAKGRIPPTRAIARFVVLAAAGMGFTALLATDAGFMGSFLAHAAYNAAILTAISVVNAGSSTRIVRFIARLPLAMVNRSDRPSRSFTVDRTNAVQRIVRGRAIKIDGAKAVKAATVPARRISADQVKTEQGKGEAKQKAILDTSLESGDEALMLEAEKVMMFWSMNGAAVNALIQEKLISAASATRELCEAKLTDPAISSKPALREYFEYGLQLAAALEADDAAAPKPLDETLIEAELKKGAQKQQGIFDRAIESNDEALILEAEKVMMFWSMNSRDVNAMIKEKRISAADATRIHCEQKLKDPAISDKPALKEYFEYGLKLAAALAADDAAATAIDPAAEMKRAEAKKTELFNNAIETNDEAMILDAEKIMMFWTMNSKAIGQLVTSRKIRVEWAIREHAEERMKDPAISSKPALMEYFEFGLRLADALTEKGADAPQEEDPLEDATGSVILVVRNPEVSEMARLLNDPLGRVKAVVLAGEFEAKHWSAWLAQSKGIPVLGGLKGDKVENVYDVVENGDTVLVDSMADRVVTNPGSDRESGFNRRVEEQTAALEVLGGWGGRPATTIDGVDIRVTSTMVEFPNPTEIKAINESANGTIGLFRTEFIFAERLPDPKTLSDNIFRMASALNGKVRIRAIDRRPGDKNTVFDSLPGNDKAELTWLTETDTGIAALKLLYRAMLSAHVRLPADKRNIEFFVPMVERRDQVEKVLRIISEVKEEMLAANEINAEVASTIAMPFGIMIETKVDSAEMKDIFAMPEISFVSIGTRDLSVSLNVRDVADRDYLTQVREIVTLATSAGKDVSLCGAYTSNESLFLFVNSLRIDNARLPSWAVVQQNIPRMKLIARSLSRTDLLSALGGRTNKARIERLLKAAQERAHTTIITSEDFELAFNRVLVHEGIEEAIRRDFDSTTYHHLRSVKADAPGGRVPLEKAVLMGYDYSLINVLGRHAIASLQFAATNNNRGVVYLARLAQNWIDRAVFGKDTRATWEIVGAEGHRPGKDPQGTLPVGANLGFGSARKEMLVLSMETPQGLAQGSGGTVLGRVYGDQDSITAFPDAYMFKAVASAELKDLPLTGIIDGARAEGQDSIDLAQAASRMVTEAERILGRKPRVAVLLRDRQRAMIETIAAALGITESYDDISTRVNASVDGHDEFMSSVENPGRLFVYAYDDWTAGLSIGQGIDLFIGTGGTPEATMSGVIARKQQGTKFAGTLIPQGNTFFNQAELANFARGGITDLRKIYDERDMVPGDPDSVAVGIAVLRDFRFGRNLDTTVSGPRVRDDGQVEANVLWVAPDGVMPVKLTYATSLTGALRKLARKKDDGAVALDVALGWAEFGAYEMASAMATEWMGKMEPGSVNRSRWEAVSYFAQAGEAMTIKTAASEESAMEAAVALYEKALAALKTPDARTIESELAIGQRVRRIYYLLRDRSLARARDEKNPNATADLAKATEYAARALEYTTRGYETRRRQNAVRLEPLVADYQAWETAQWGAKATAPSTQDKLGAAYDIFMKYRTQEGFISYAASLDKENAQILNAVLFATVLNTVAIDDQGRILRYLQASADARSLAAAMMSDAPPARDVFIRSMSAFMENGLRRRPWQSVAVEHVPAERRVFRPEFNQFLARVQSRPEASAVLAELIVVTMAKADVMPALGNADRRLAYLRDAATYAELIEAHPRLLGADPLSLIFEISVLYEALAQQSGEPGHVEKARKFSALTRNGSDFIEFLASLKDENGTRLYGDTEVEAIEARRFAFQSANDVAQTDVPPATNSLPYFLALLWNAVVGPALRFSNPERFIRIGYVLEIFAGLALVSSFAATPWAAQAVFFIGTTPLTGLAAVVLGGAVGYAALHVAVWSVVAALKGGLSPAAALRRLGLHTLGFLPYVVFAQVLALDPGFGITTAILAFAAALSHAAFDEAATRGVRLDAAQQARYEALLEALHARESREGTLSRRIDTILPANATPGLRDAFQTAFDDSLRSAARTPERTLSNAIDSALNASAAGPILVFITAGGPSPRELAQDAFARSQAEARDGERRPVLFSIDPDVPDAQAVLAEITALQNANGATPSSVVRLGEAVQARDGEFHYEDIFAAFAADPRLAGYANARAMLQALSEGRAEAGTRIVQINASSQRIVGSDALLQLILLIVPLNRTSVLIDIRAVMLAATQA